MSTNYHTFFIKKKTQNTSLTCFVLTLTISFAVTKKTQVLPPQSYLFVNISPNVALKTVNMSYILPLKNEGNKV